ncbi:protein of unknown function [Rhodovastum atsumiense]|nr:protein of unknown function [Rhodovastum atsumiense]
MRLFDATVHFGFQIVRQGLAFRHLAPGGCEFEPERRQDDSHAAVHETGLCRRHRDRSGTERIGAILPQHASSDADSDGVQLVRHGSGGEVNPIPALVVRPIPGDRRQLRFGSDNFQVPSNVFVDWVRPVPKGESGRQPWRRWTPQGLRPQQCPPDCAAQHSLPVFHIGQKLRQSLGRNGARDLGDHLLQIKRFGRAKLFIAQAHWPVRRCTHSRYPPF